MSAISSERSRADAIALTSLGYMLAERGDPYEAVTLLQRAQSRANNPSYLDSLGRAYFQQGRVGPGDPPLTRQPRS